MSKPSLEQMSRIYSAWMQGHPPIKTAKALRLTTLTVIREYVRLDEHQRFGTTNADDFCNTYWATTRPMNLQKMK